MAGMSQTTINFAYDSAGNRVSRTIELPASPTMFGGGGGTAEFREDENFFTEILAEKEIKIYPNPTRGQLRVEILGYENLDKNSSIQVFTSGGALLYKTGNLKQTNDINLTDKPAGLYIMLINIGGERSTWKIIKQ
jgi:hypothetical protein